MPGRVRIWILDSAWIAFGLRLEAALGASAQFWLNAQTAWDLWHQRRSPEAAQSKKIKRVSAMRSNLGVVDYLISYPAVTRGASARASCRRPASRR